VNLDQPDSRALESARDHALRLIEFPRALDLIAARATSALGAERVRALRPWTEHAAVEEALATTEDMVSYVLRTPEWGPPPIPNVRAALSRLGVDGSVLESLALRDCGVLLASSRRARQDVRRRTEDFGRIAALADRLLVQEALEERLDRSIDPAGELTDAASPELSRLRRSLRSERSSLVARLERFTGELPDRLRVADASVTVRAGRYCVPVRRGGRSQVGGIVHDESASTQTLFVEPAFAIEPMNRVRELELAERREIQRILAELSDTLRPLVSELSESLDALSELDALFALANYALDHGGTRPKLIPEGEEAGYRAHQVLVSGPNAGGKTVLLKAIGLLSALAQSGVIPPVGETTSLPVFDSFFAIIGDEQSIDASLSTFSAQIGNLREILESSDGRSLVLVDEIGSNTDPAEGGALAAAVLLRLSSQTALTVVSTHLGELKTLAGEEPRIVNASLQFDPATLRPTYRLLRDRPGRSYALEISQRLGIAADVLEVARARLSEGSRALETVLAELEEREDELNRLRGTLERERAVMTEERTVLDEEKAEATRRSVELKDRERAAEREARGRAERYLLDARRDVEETISTLQEGFGQLIAELPDSIAGEREALVDKARTAARVARRAVESSLSEVRSGAPEPPEESEAAVDPVRSFDLGDRVQVASLAEVGRLVTLEADRAVVELGGVRMTVSPAVLRIAPEEPEKGVRSGRKGEWRAPSLTVSSEVDLRGLRVDEIEPALVPALDAAIQADLPRLRVIHGKGTGALRERVRQLLAGDARVPSFRLGTYREGGIGVTVVELTESD
jgi:DNA mismatch repair protein MutS2